MVSQGSYKCLGENNMFCPKCGSIMMPKTVDDKKVLGCSCGYVDKKSDSKMTETVKKKDSITVIEDNREDEMLPTTNAECPKCHNKESYYWLVQTRSADEPETKFLKCTKCKHTFRDYS